MLIAEREPAIATLPHPPFAQRSEAAKARAASDFPEPSGPAKT
jgi:hypothetical protein